MAFLFSFTQMVLAALLIVLVLMHSGKDAGLSGMFNPGQSSFGGTAVMERNLNRLTVLVADPVCRERNRARIPAVDSGGPRAGGGIGRRARLRAL